MEHISNRAAPDKLKSVFTSKEVEELGFSTGNLEPPPNPTKCKYCGKTLYYEAVCLNGAVMCWNRKFPQRCDCEKAKVFWDKYDAEKKRDAEEQEKTEVEEKKRKAFLSRINRILGESGIKKRFMSRTFENYNITPENRSAFNAAKEYADSFEYNLKTGKGIYFEVTNGTGKTHLAVAISLQLIKNGVPVICKSSIDLLADIKKAYDKAGDISENAVIDIYRKVDLLIIDDLGKEQCTPWTVSTLYAILDYRYEDMKPTIITTNYNEEMLIKRLTPQGGDSLNAEAIVSRFRECNDVVTMAWDDYRSVKNG
jgi:DNA replication protein DnaC